jgi:hypothetical protein
MRGVVEEGNDEGRALADLFWMFFSMAVAGVNKWQRPLPGYGLHSAL